MRLIVASTGIALLFGLSPASAMCGGGGQQAGGMCGSSGAGSAMKQQMSEWPAATQAQPEQKQAGGMGMCACCKNMAMMDGKKADDPHKGMDMPKQ